MGDPTTTITLVILTALSLAAWGIAVARLRRPSDSPRPAQVQRALVAATAIACAALFAYRWALVHHRWQPLGAHVDGLLLIAALFAGAIVFMQARPRLAGLSAFALPLLSLILAWGICASAWTYHPFNLETLHPVWMTVHLGGVYLGTLSSALAAIAGGMFLYVQHRLKQKIGLAGIGRLASLETLETVIVRSATLGFVLLSLGLASGLVILSDDGGGTLGSWLPVKITLAATAWLVYAVLMNVRYASTFRGARAAWLSIAGLVLLMATYGIVTALPHEDLDRGAWSVEDAPMPGVTGEAA